MAYDPSINRGVIAPVLHTVDPGPQALTSPPPLPPFALPSVGYVVPVPVASFHNPNFRSPFYSESFLPPRVALDQSVLAQMDDYRAQFLLQVMESEGLVPSPEEEMKRKKVIKELKQIVLSWIRKVAWQRHLPKDIIAKTNATVLTYGSYGLGVHGPESDIDALCVGPYFASIEDDFFTVLHGLLQSRPEVSELHCVKTAKVPLMRFKFNGISIDFPYAQLRVVSVPDDVNIFDPSLVIPDESQKSFSGVRVNTRILQLVPNLRNFQALLRCIKLWAKRRGVYSHLLGFFGGIHLAILATFVCQRYPTASINALMTMFFETFLHWPWPDPIILHGQSMPFKSPDERCFMPILMPCSPFDWCNSNITRSTFRKIITEFQRGYDITKDHGRLDFQWGHVFTHFPYSMCYPYFVSICLVAPDQEELQDWVGWVKSRFRSLLLKLEREFGYCDPNPNEYVDMTVGQPNVVFFWGLLSPVGDFCDLNSIKEEFVRSIVSSREEHAVRKNTQQCKLEMSILEALQIPADIQINSGGEKGLKACWRNMDYYQCQHRKPLYSQYLPHYVVGYMASGADCCNIPFG